MSTIKPLIYDATNNRLAEMEMAMPFGKNLLINAECLINQRVFSGGALGEGVYGYDRFKAGAGGCNFSVSGGVWTHASGPIVQIVETPTGVYGSNVTFSVEDPTEDISVTVGGVGGTITAGSGRRGVTLAIPAGSGNLTVQWSATGATYSRPQLERGYVTTAFDYRPEATEINLCLRYFEKSFPLAVAPAQNAGSAGAISFTQAVPAGYNQYGNHFPYKVLKRDNPSVTLYNPSAENSFAHNANIGNDCTLTQLGSESSTSICILTLTMAPGSSPGQNNILHFIADSEL